MTRHCDCRSYNRPEVGSVPSVVLDAPDWANKPQGICVDACIAHAVTALWRVDYITLSSCCGHAGKLAGYPDLVLGHDETDFPGIREVIASVDDRLFRLLQWQLAPPVKPGTVLHYLVDVTYGVNMDLVVFTNEDALS